MVVLFVILGIVIFFVAAAFLYFICSPMPVVRLLRRGMEDDLGYPGDYDSVKEQVEIHKDLEYPSQYGNHMYDLYLPKKEGKHPLILWVHGGAFVAGDKAGVENWGVMLAGQGYAVAAMNYCLAPEAAYPAQIRQICEALTAVASFSESSARKGKIVVPSEDSVIRDAGSVTPGAGTTVQQGNGIDLGNVAVAGDSAGAYMAAQFAVAHANPVLAEQIGVASPLGKNTLKCALLFCGPYNVKRMFNVEDKKLRLFISRIGWSFLGKKNWSRAPLISTVTPMDFVTRQTVPCYITDGNTMSFEPQGRALGEALRKNGVKVKERYFARKEYGEVSHEYQMRLETENAMHCFEDVVEFLGECM